MSVDKALALVDQLSSKEEAQVNEKLTKEKEKKTALNAKQKEKRLKKKEKKEKINQLVDELQKQKEQEEIDKQPVKVRALHSWVAMWPLTGYTLRNQRRGGSHSESRRLKRRPTYRRNPR